MSRNILRAAALVMLTLAAGWIGMTVGASGGASEAGPWAVLAHHFHGHGHHGHGHGHGKFGSHREMQEFLAALRLNADQEQRIEQIHAYLMNHAGDVGQKHHQLLAWLIGKLEDESLDQGEVRALVDQHLEEIRTLVYAASDELVLLVSSFDAEQQELLLGHLRQLQNSTRHGSAG